jgi:ketosteroid isomerase-like protein
LAGTKKGRDEVFAYFGQLGELSNGTIKVIVHDVIGGDDHTIGLHHDYAERNGKVIDHNVVLVFHLADGKVTEVWELHEDAAKNDAFWS